MSETKLLILDDDVAVAQMMQDVASTAGIPARCTTEPTEFFAAVQEWKPTHLVIDLRMPQMDGVEVMVHLSEMHCTSLIIISSGVGDRVLDAAARSAQEHGLRIAGVLPKPFSPRILLMLLASSKSGLEAEAEAARAPRAPFEATAENLAKAIQNEEIIVYYQPKIECLAGRVLGFEALARWQHPEFGLITPDKFIPVAESSGLMGELTYRVLDLALGCLSRHFTAVLSDQSSKSPVAHTRMKVAVNMSPQVLRQQDFLEHLVGACDANGIETYQLILELTESSAMENPVESLAMLTRLRVRGFHLSLDDFGTGYSSMLQLVQLPFSEIKIDRSFVMTLNHSAESRSVVRSIVSLGQSLGLQTTAEGVEEIKALDYLKQIGCDVAQGYKISRPIPEDELVRWYAERCSNGYWKG